MDISSYINLSLYIYNSPPTAQYLTLNVSSNGSINNYTCSAGGTGDIDSDTIISYFLFKSGLTVLQAESTTNYYTASSGTGTHGEIINCTGRVYDSSTYSDYYTNLSHLKISDTINTTSFTVDSNGTISVYVNSTSSVSGVNLTLIGPSGSIYSNLEMTYNSGSLMYDYIFAPSESGAWTINKIFAFQSNTEGYTFVGSGDSFLVGSTGSSSSSGGGRGGTTIIEVPIAILTNFTEGCGDNICAEGETPIGCWEDCRVNYDTLFTCTYDRSIECNWKQTWFPAFLIFSLIGIGVVSIYYYEVRGKKNGKKQG